MIGTLKQCIFNCNHWTESSRIFLRYNSFFRLFLRQTNACITGSVVQCGIRCRFHQQKKWCFGCRSCCQTLSSRGWLRISLVPIVLHVLHVFAHFSDRPTSWSSPMFRCYFRKESSCSRMNGLGMVKVHWEPKGCVAFVFFQRQGWR